MWILIGCAQPCKIEKSNIYGLTVLIFLVEFFSMRQWFILRALLLNKSLTNKPNKRTNLGSIFTYFKGAFFRITHILFLKNLFYWILTKNIFERNDNSKNMFDILYVTDIIYFVGFLYKFLIAISCKVERFWGGYFLICFQLFDIVQCPLKYGINKIL